MAAFDAAEMTGTMADFEREGKGKFIVKSPNADDVVVEGFDAILDLEKQFTAAIVENFGKCFHELIEWKWEDLVETHATARCYTRLWLTDKATGNWNQQDLSGKSGRFWLVFKWYKAH